MGKKENASAENIKVFVRCRPLSVKEKANKHTDCTEINLAAHCIGVKDNLESRNSDNVDWNSMQHRWTFDAVINHTFSQADIFSQFILPLVDSVLDGFNATVFAYGQSGSGKTHTMTGNIGDLEEEGIIPRCIKYIFNTIQNSNASITSAPAAENNSTSGNHAKASRSHSNASSSSSASPHSPSSAKLPNAQLMGDVTTEPGRRFSLKVSFVELYNGKVRDLLALKQVPLDVREQRDHTFFVSGCNLLPVTSPEEILRLMNEGTERRRTASTDLNDVSSRSHSLFTVYMECHEMTDEGTTRMVSSKLNLVDLAGSERQSKTNATGDTLKEGCNINLSLSALGTVIDTIVKGSPHIPYRSSPLTMLLKDSLGGNAKTVMFATISPSEHNISETISTLRFADRAKQIKNKPVVNMDIKDQKIFELSNLVHELKEKLARYETEGTQSLEEEVEKLRTRVCELEVTLDGVSKERVEDEEALDHVKQKYVKEREEIERQCTSLQEEVAELRSKLQIAISERDERKSAFDEVMKVCSKYLNKGKLLKTVEELTAALKKFIAKLENSNSQRAQWDVQIENIKNEKLAIERELERVQTEMKEQAEEHKLTMERSEEKAAKLMKELQESLNNTINSSSSSSSKNKNASKSKQNKKGDNESDGENSDEDEDEEEENGDSNKRDKKKNNSKKKKNNNKHKNKRKDDASPRSNGTQSEEDELESDEEEEYSDEEEEENDESGKQKHGKSKRASKKNKKNSKNGFDSTLEENGETDSSTVSGQDSRNNTRTENGADGLKHFAKPRNLKTAIIELEMLKSELSEVQLQRETATIARDKLNEELRLRRDELLKVEKRNNELMNEMNELRNDFTRKLAEVSNQSEELHFAETRLQKRTEQVNEMRALLEEQKELIDKSNERAREAQRKLDEVIKSSTTTEQYYKRMLQEKDEMFQSQLNERISQYTAERQREADDKINANVKKLKKKMKKLQESMAELEKEYDVKVCECEELRNVLSDQKVSYFKLQQRVEMSDDEYELDDGKEQVRSALERAKEEQRRRSDMFSNGEMMTPKVRPVKLPRMAKSARVMRNGAGNSRINLNGTVSDGEYLNDFEDED